MDYIDLNRTFSVCAPDGEDSERDYWRFLRRRQGDQQDWPWLLRSPLVVILDEAGAGKTSEFRGRAAKLRAAGEYAFFVPIERLCRVDLAEALDEPEDVQLLARWLRSRRRATFFLDSVDEAKLPVDRDVNPLQASIRRLEREIGRRWPRVRLVISSRPSAWTAELELAETQRLARRFEALGVRGEADGIPVERYVHFDPLDGDQQAALGSHDQAPEGFVQALHDSGAGEIAGTPLDLLDLSAAYKTALDEGRSGTAAFDSLSQIVESAIERRATETGSGSARTTLPAARIRGGARRLAYACVLGQQLSIRLPGSVGEGIDPLAVLKGTDPDWSRQDVAQLLATGLFTAAWAGAVRFHHRRSMERLAAEAFDELLRAGLEVQTLADVLTPSAFGLFSVPPPFVETLGWLATLNPSFRTHVLKAAPHVLLELGDPGVLPIPTREAALRGHVARYAEVRWRGEWFPNVKLARFVHPLLADLCIELLALRAPVEPLGHVLQMIEVGELKTCADEVAALAEDPQADVGLRCRAVSTLASVGGPAHLASLAGLGRALIRPPSDPDGHARHVRNDFRRACATVGRPNAMTLAQAMGCLIRLEPRDRTYASNRDGELIRALVDECPPSELPRLVRWLGRVCWEPSTRRFGNSETPLWSMLGSHLLPLLEAACARCLGARPDLHDWSQLSIECDRIVAARQVGGGPLDRYGDWDDDRFAQAVSDSPVLRRRMFMATVEAESSRAGSPSTMLGRITRWRRAKQPNLSVADDIPWLEALYLTHTSAEMRRAAFDALSIRLIHLPATELRAARQRLLTRARSVGDRDVEAAITWSARRSLRQLRWKIERMGSAIIRFRHRHLPRGRDWGGGLRRRFALHWFAGDVAAGNRAGLAVWALYGHSHDRRKPFDEVRAQFGARVSGALREGAKAFALRQEPGTLGSRKTYGDHYAALGWEAWALDDPNRVDALAPDDARRALTALLKEDEFPDWARRLASRLPSEWHDVAAPPVDAELRSRSHPLQPTYSPMVSRVARAEQGVRNPLAATAIAALKENSAPAPQDVRSAAAIILADHSLHPALLSLARFRSRTWLSAGECNEAASWLQIWLHLDPDAAWACVREFLNGPWQGDDALMVALAGDLYGLQLSSEALEGRVPISPRLRALIASDLKRHVRVDLDLDRDGEVNRRHRAQEMRDGVLKGFSDDPSPDARQALLTLRLDPIFADWDHWVARLLMEQAAAAAAPKRWPPETAVQFATVWTTRPRSAAELTDFVARQIGSILKELATSEFDLRGLFRTARERDVRAFFGAALEARSQGWYGVTQEPVTAGEKRRDLRIEARSAHGEIVTVELKIAGQSWTGDALVEHIESQLVQQYLLSRHVRCGLYVVIAFDRKNWPMTDGDNLDFDGLATRLHAEAEQISARYQGLEVLKVIAERIDLPPVEPRTRARTRTPREPARVP